MASFTEKAIIDSFINLLNEKPLDKITVKDIVEDCGINRNTFYYHFDDIPSLVSRILEDETNRALSLHGDVDSWEEGFIAAAQFALNNKRLIYHIYNSVSREVFERYLNDITWDIMYRFVDTIGRDVACPELDKKLIASFYKSALVGMVLDWLAKGMKYDPEEIIHRLGAMLDGNIRASIKKVEQKPAGLHPGDTDGGCR